MTGLDRAARQLPALLDELAAARTPEYLDDLHKQLAGTRQPPAWTLPERWLPMLVARQPVLTGRSPWRAIAVLAIVATLLAAMALIAAGSRRIPAPFGPVENGLVVYASNGEIFTMDPASGRATAVVTDPATDVRPVWSPDGQSFVFERKAANPLGPGDLYLAQADGSAPHRLTQTPIESINDYVFSPDGREIAVSAGAAGQYGIWIVNVDGSGVRRLAAGNLGATGPDYRPRSGSEIVFVGREVGKFASGLFSVRSDGTGLGTIVAPTTFVIANPRWSPKGDRLSYTSLAVDHSTPARPHIVDADGTNDRILGSFAEDETGGLPNLWSNDGTRLLIGRCHRPSVDDTGCDLRYSIVAVDGLGPEQMIADGILDFGDSSQAWAPDDSYIVASTSQGEQTATQLWDTSNGTVRAATWAAGGPSSVQRRAP
jgi:dipeptidyl aminopeptidase/acylaminoacyl peptidase